VQISEAPLWLKITGGLFGLAMSAACIYVGIYSQTYSRGKGFREAAYHRRGIQAYLLYTYAAIAVGSGVGSVFGVFINNITQTGHFQTIFNVMIFTAFVTSVIYGIILMRHERQSLAAEGVISPTPTQYVGMGFIMLGIFLACFFFLMLPYIASPPCPPYGPILTICR
jgi:hypothetical protein